MSAQLTHVADLRPLDRPLANRRIYKRKPCDLSTTCRPTSAMAMQEMGWTDTVVDISQGGLHINLKRRFEKERAWPSSYLPTTSGNAPSSS